LVEVAITNPRWTYDEVYNTRPTHSRRAIRPHLEIDLLVPLQIRGSQFLSLALVLDRLLPGPANRERTGGSCNKVWIFAGALHCIEDDLQVWGDREPHQCRLWRMGFRDCAKNPQPGLSNECEEIRFGKHRDAGPVYDVSAVNAISGSPRSIRFLSDGRFVLLPAAGGGETAATESYQLDHFKRR
jgi:hypothetical protein